MMGYEISLTFKDRSKKVADEVPLRKNLYYSKRCLKKVIDVVSPALLSTNLPKSRMKMCTYYLSTKISFISF